MAGAIITGLVTKGILPAASIRASSPSGPNAELRGLGIVATRDNAEAVAGATIVIFAVKPLLMEAAVVSCRDVIAENTIVVSVAAGVTSTQIQGWLGEARPRAIVRAMPNTPTAVGEGACGICPGANGLATAEHVFRVQRLFSAAGVVHAVKESQMDAITGLSGSGPAFVCLVIEALADGGVAAGLPRPVALSLATQLVSYVLCACRHNHMRTPSTLDSEEVSFYTLFQLRPRPRFFAQVKGTATLVQATGQHPAVLKDNVASPGGTTIAGIHALETGGLRGTLMSAVVAATKRATELSAAAAAAGAAAPK